MVSNIINILAYFHGKFVATHQGCDNSRY